MDLAEWSEEQLAALRKEVKQELERVGQEAVEIAKSSIAYKDRTGNLRASNSYEADEECLTIKNTAYYASFVEARTGNVIADAVLYAKNELNAQ